MDCASDVVDGIGLVDQSTGLRVVEVDGAWIGELSEALLVGVSIFQQIGVSHGDGNLLAAFFGVADCVDLHARTGCGEQSEILVDIFGVWEDVGCS